MKRKWLSLGGLSFGLVLFLFSSWSAYSTYHHKSESEVGSLRIWPWLLPSRNKLVEWEQVAVKYSPSCFTDSSHVNNPMTANEIVAQLAQKFTISERTHNDISEAIQLGIVNIDKRDAENIKIVLGYHGYEHTPHYTWYNFTGCKYSNCIPLNPHRTEEHPMAPENVTSAASIILFNLVEMYEGRTLPAIPRRSDQYFGVTSLESTGYPYNLMSHLLDGQMNMTLTYHRNSTVPEWHIFKACMKKRQIKKPSLDYSHGKTNGAIAYVSNCFSMQYDRLNMMEILKKYIPVTIYGKCGEPDPCSSDDCRAQLHRTYRFYLAFENSLCEDYITEKFWDRLSEDAYLLPVAMGGLSVQEYVDFAPENSFIHLRNFSSIHALGEYLKQLMDDDALLNSYHKWREDWEIQKRPIYSRFPACELCRIANEKPYMPANEHLSTVYNNEELCQTYHTITNAVNQ